MRLWFLLLSFFATAAHAQEIVTLDTRPGVTQSFFVANMGDREPEAVALMFAGGGGSIRLRMEGGRPKFQEGNFLPRSRREFIRNRVLPVLVDNPSDQQAGDGMSDGFRASESHVRDIRAVLREVKRRFPGLPVFIVGTSRGTISAAWLGRALGTEVSGVVLTSSLFRQGKSQAPVLAAFDFATIRAPLLFVHHREDGCPATPYHEAAQLGEKFPLISVKGGKSPQSGPCDPFAAHGYFGKEPETVDAIAAWMLKKPYPREID